MSSTYRLLCVSHDPALTFGEYDSPEQAETAIREGVGDHPRCDLLIGRYSYPLIEVGCPSTAGRGDTVRGVHGVHLTTEWVDAGWLHLLAVVQESGSESMRALTQTPMMRCWTRERMRRLRDELGLTLDDTEEAEHVQP